MAKNSNALFAASSGYAVWTAPLGTTLPTSSVVNPGAAWYEFGYLNEDGIGKSRDVNENKVFDLLGQLLRIIRNQEEHGFTVTAMEDNRVVRELANPGSVLTSIGGTAEVQSVTVNGSPTGGSFTLSGGFGTSGTTSPIVYNAAASAVQSAIQGLPGLSGVTVTGSAGGPYTVTFPAALGNVAQLTANGAGLTGGTSPSVTTATTTPGVNGSNSRAVGSGTGLNARCFYLYALDGSKSQSFAIGNGEAVATGDSTISGNGVKTTQFKITPYPDSSGTFFYLLDNDPNQAVAYA